jgi:hypothetical protein
VARLVTLTTLQNRVLQRANLENAGNASIYTASELLDNINEGVAEWYELFVEASYPFYLNSATFQTTLQSDTYVIGSGQAINVTDFYKCKGVDVMFAGQNIVITCRTWTWNERNRYKYLGGWIYSQPISYAMVGKTSAIANAGNDSVRFIPTPSGQFSCTLWYYPTPPVLASGSDAIDGMNGSEEIVVLSAAIKMLEKQEQFEHADRLKASKAEEVQRLLKALVTRDAENPPRIQDVSQTDGWVIGPGY